MLASRVSRTVCRFLATVAPDVKPMPPSRMIPKPAATLRLLSHGGGVLTVGGDDLGQVRSVAFPVGAGATAGDLDRLLQSHRALEGAVLELQDGSVVPEDLALEELAHLGFVIRKGGARLAVSTGGKMSLDDGTGSIEEVLRLGSTVLLRKALMARPERVLRLEEYHAVARAVGLSRTEASAALGDFHRGGLVAHFSNHVDPDVRDCVFLRADETLDEIFEGLGLEGPGRQFVREQKARKEKELVDIEDALGPLRAAQALVEQSAKRVADVTLRLGFLGLTSGIGFFVYLTTSALSWDVVEPMVWLTGAAGKSRGNPLNIFWVGARKPRKVVSFLVFYDTPPKDIIYFEGGKPRKVV